MEQYILEIGKAPLWIGYTMQSMYLVLSFLFFTLTMRTKSIFDFVIYTLITILTVVASLATANGLGIL